MPAHFINIDVDPITGSFTYTPSSLRAAPSDTIVWQSPKAIALMFLDGTPIAHMEVFAYASMPTPAFTVISGAEGHFHYAVAAWDGIRVYIDSGCPDIIVN